MTEPNWLCHGLRLGVVGTRRTFRRLRRDRYRFRIAAFSAVCLAICVGGMGVLYALLLATYTDSIVVPGGVRIGVSLAWVAGVWFLTQRALLHWRTPTAKGFVLTTVSTRTVALGMLLTEFLSACVLLAAPTALLVGIVGYVFASPGALVLVPLSVALFASSAVAVGYAAGFASLFVSAGSHGLTKRRRHLLVQLVLLFGVGYLLLADGPVIPEGPTVAWLPTSWLVDLAVLGTRVEVSVDRALAGVAAFLTLIVGAGVLAERLAGRYWTTDRTRAESGSDDGPAGESSRPGGSALADAISPVVVPEALGPPTQRIAQLAVLRLRRAPRRLLVLLTMVVSVGIYVGTVLGRVEDPFAVVPVVSAVFVPWVAGAALGLNPLGDEGAVLPTTLVSSISGREFVGGLALPAVLYGLPIAVVSTALGAISAVSAVVAASLAPAIGTRFPRFSGVTVGASDGVVPPSLSAILLYTLAVAALCGGVVLALVAPAGVYRPIAAGTVPVAWLRVGVVACGVALNLVVAKQGFDGAARRFDSYSIR